MTDENTEEAALDRLFAAARDTDAEPSPDFLARLHADAETHRPDIAVLPRRRRTLRVLEGWGLAASLASTVAVGVAIGVALPETTLGRAEDDTLSALLPGYGAAVLLQEGL